MSTGNCGYSMAGSFSNPTKVKTLRPIDEYLPWLIGLVKFAVRDDWLARGQECDGKPMRG